MLEGARLDEEELAWMDRFAQVAGRQMTEAGDEAMDQYLSGRIEEKAFFHFVEEMTRVSHLDRQFKPLLQGADRLALVREGLLEADAAAEAGRHADESKRISQILSQVDLAGLAALSDYLNGRLDRAWLADYGIEIQQIRHEMARDRTYDAVGRIDHLLDYFPEDQELLAFRARCEENNPESVRTWWDPVEHLAIKPLIADPARAFDGDRYQEAADRDLLLSYEFGRVLDELYRRDYVLVDSLSFVTGQGGLRGIPCPAGKKPLVLVLEDFYSSFPRAESGVAWRLDLNDQGQVVGVLLDRDGSERADRLYSAIGILETFIEDHPDFSFNGATGVIAVVGQYGLLGYPLADAQDLALQRSAEGMEPAPPLLAKTDFDANRNKVRQLLEALDLRNWTMANGSYGRLSLPFASRDEIEKDLIMARDWLEPYTGKLTALYCPFGDHLQASPDKAALFTGAGYLLQSGYGEWAYWESDRSYVYVSRTLLTGRHLRLADPGALGRLIDPKAVIDRSARP